MTELLAVITENDHLTKAMFTTHGYKCITPFDKQYRKEVDLVVFTGGADVDPELYGEKKIPSTNINPHRDGRDNAVWDYYEGIPRVGICRGSQFLNVKEGGALWQDVNNHGRTHDLINLLAIPGTTFDYNTKVSVTSTHHQMMIPSEKGITLGIAYEATRFSSYKDRNKPEFDTEVVWYPESNTLCCQFHPEYLQKDSDCRKYFFALVDNLITNPQFALPF